MLYAVLFASCEGVKEIVVNDRQLENVKNLEKHKKLKVLTCIQHLGTEPAEGLGNYLEGKNNYGEVEK